LHYGAPVRHSDLGVGARMLWSIGLLTQDDSPFRIDPSSPFRFNPFMCRSTQTILNALPNLRYLDERPVHLLVAMPTQNRWKPNFRPIVDHPHPHHPILTS
jgi:hypothetical protein